jgi:hypothetical protein
MIGIRSGLVFPNRPVNVMTIRAQAKISNSRATISLMFFPHGLGSFSIRSWRFGAGPEATVKADPFLTQAARALTRKQIPSAARRVRFDRQPSPPIDLTVAVATPSALGGELIVTDAVRWGRDCWSILTVSSHITPSIMS